MDAMTQLQEFFKQKYREEAEAEVVRHQLERRRRDEAVKQRKLSKLYTKYQALSSSVGEQLGNVENMDRTIDSKIVGLHKAQTLMLDQTNTLHLQVKSKYGDLEKVKPRAAFTTHGDIESIKHTIDESDKENCHKQQRIRNTRKRIKTTQRNISQTKRSILGERNTQQQLVVEETALETQRKEHEHNEKELAREVRALEAVMKVQAEASDTLKNNLENLENEIDELKRAADTSKNEEYNNLKAEIKKKNLQQRDAVRLKQKLQKESEQVEKDFSELKPNLDKITASHVERKTVVSKLREECTAVEQANSTIETALKQKKEVLGGLQNTNESLNNENSVESFEKELKKLHTSTTRQTKKTQTSEIKLEKARSDLKALEEGVEAKSNGSDYDEAAQQLTEQETANSNQQGEIEESETRLKEATESCAAVSSELDALTKEVEGIEKEMSDTEQRLQNEQKSAEAKGNDRQSLEEAQKQTESEIEDEEKRIQEYIAATERRQKEFEESIKQLSSAHEDHIKELEAMFEKQRERKQKLADEFKKQNEEHERRKSEVAEKIRAIEKELASMEEEDEDAGRA